MGAAERDQPSRRSVARPQYAIHPPGQCHLGSRHFFFQAKDGIRDGRVTGVQTCALPIWWRVRDNEMPIDSRGELWDGTQVNTPADLRNALLARRESILRTFTRNLMAYGLGRRVEYYDMPSIRSIVRTAGTN